MLIYRNCRSALNGFAVWTAFLPAATLAAEQAVVAEDLRNEVLPPKPVAPTAMPPIFMAAWAPWSAQRYNPTPINSPSSALRSPGKERSCTTTSFAHDFGLRFNARHAD